MQGKIFISYSRKDKEAIKGYLNLFSANDLDVWIDQSGINASTEWAEQIVSAITDCDVFILFLSKTSVESENVRKEIGVATTLGKKVLPLKIEDVDIPPSMLYHLNSIHFLEVNSISQEQLVSHVVKAIGISDPKPVITCAPEKKAKKKPAAFIIALAIIAVLLIFVVISTIKNSGEKIILGTDSTAPNDVQTTNITANSPTSGARSSGVRTAILYFENNSADRPDLQPLAKGLAHMLGTEASGVDGIDIVERNEIEKVLNELQLSNSKNFDTESAARIGKLLGAQQLVLGSFMELFGKFRVDAKIVNVETGFIVKAGSAKGDSHQFDAIAEELAASLFNKQKLEIAEAALSTQLPVEVAIKVGEALQKIDDGNASDGIIILNELLLKYPESEVIKNAIRSVE